MPTRSPHAEEHVRLLGVAVDDVHARLTGHPSGAPSGCDGFATLHQPGSEVFAHQCDDVIVVDVARHRHHHAIRRVAADVEGMQLGPRHRRDRLDTADHGSTHRVIAEHRRQEDVPERVLRIVVAHRDLLQHDVAFHLDVVGRALAPQHDVGDQVDRQLQIGVEHVRVVAGVLAGGERVQLTAHRVDRLRDLHRRTRGRRLEQEMFEEVGGARHAVTLVARPDADPHSHGSRAHRRNEFRDDAKPAG
jgi:hypothetical protein